MKIPSSHVYVRGKGGCEKEKSHKRAVYSFLFIHANGRKIVEGDTKTKEKVSLNLLYSGIIYVCPQSAGKTELPRFTSFPLC